jgi:4'-phosphopantetheinyl transferase EntD
MPDSIPFQFEFNQDGIRSFFTKEKICLPPAQIGLPINHQFSEKRFADFSTGRYCAMKAMEHLGFNNIKIPIREEREPIWPEGLVGSISHCDSLTGALVAKSSDHISLGLDIEEIGRVTPDLWDLVFTENEKRYLSGLSEQEMLIQSTVIFSAKEAFYKFQHPLTNSFLDFLEVEVQLPEINRIILLLERFPSASIIQKNSLLFIYDQNLIASVVLDF